MDVLQAIRERRSIRRFTAEPLDRAVVEEIVAQALWAPTSCNRQMWRFIIVDRETLHARLSKSAGYVAGIDPAVAVFVCCDPRYNPEHHAIVQGAAAGVQNMLLAAHSMGLGGLWMCGYGNEEAIKKELRIPEFYTILCAVAFGHPNESFSTPARRPYEDVVCWNEFAWSGEAAGPPASWHPRQWTVSQLQEYVNYSVRAKSPSTAFYRPFMKGEFEAEMASVPVMAGRTVVFAPFSGNHMFELHRRGKFQGTVEAVVLAPEIARFLQEKRGDMGSDLDVHYSVYEGGRLPLEDASVDNVFCAHHLEHFADPGPIVEEMRRVLKPDGRLVLLFSNACSPYYLLWRVDKHRSNPSAGLRGPFCPITPFAVRRLLRRGFRYERAVGVTPLPYGRFQSVRWRGLLRYVCKGWVSLWTKRG